MKHGVTRAIKLIRVQKLKKRKKMKCEESSFMKNLLGQSKDKIKEN